MKKNFWIKIIKKNGEIWQAQVWMCKILLCSMHTKSSDKIIWIKRENPIGLTFPWNISSIKKQLIVLLKNWKQNLNFYFLENDYRTLRRSADIAVLLTATETDLCGVSNVYSFSAGTTLGVIRKDCAVGYYCLGHEVPHQPTFCNSFIRLTGTC